MNIEELIASFSEVGGACPLDQLVEFEKRMGARLPDDYRDFLTRCNGGYAPGFLTSRTTIDAGDKFIGPSCFFGIGYPFPKPEYPDDTNWTLIDLNEMVYDGRIPKDCVLFADDVFGNGFLIGTIGDARGKIFFWDHEEEHLNDSGWKVWKRWNGLVAGSRNTKLLADTFLEYLENLYDNEEDGEQ